MASLVNADSLDLRQLVFRNHIIPDYCTVLNNRTLRERIEKWLERTDPTKIPQPDDICLLENLAVEITAGIPLASYFRTIADCLA